MSTFNLTTVCIHNGLLGSHGLDEGTMSNMGGEWRMCIICIDLRAEKLCDQGQRIINDFHFIFWLIGRLEFNQNGQIMRALDFG